jgi:hypothetical protein
MIINVLGVTGGKLQERERKRGKCKYDALLFVLPEIKRFCRSFFAWSEIPSVWCKFVLRLSAFIRGPFTKITCEISLFLLRAGKYTQKAILNFLACAHRRCVIPPSAICFTQNSRFTSRSEEYGDKFLKSLEISEAYSQFKEVKQFSYTHTLLFSEKSFGNDKNAYLCLKICKEFPELEHSSNSIWFPVCFAHPEEPQASQKLSHKCFMSKFYQWGLRAPFLKSTAQNVPFHDSPASTLKSPRIRYKARKQYLIFKPRVPRLVKNRPSNIFA